MGQKSAFDFLRPGYLTSKKLQQRDLTSSTLQSWTQDVVERRTTEGKKYFQIAIPSNLSHGIAAPMLYRANELPGVQRKKYVKTTGESFKNTESMVDADDVNGATSRQDLLRTLPKALKDDDLGLLEAYPHLISKQVLTKSINRAGIAPSTLILSEAGHASQVPVHASKPRSSESAMTPAAKNTLRSTKHGRDKVRQANTVAHPTCSKSNALRVHGLSSRDASKGITVRSSGIVHIGAVPINALRRPDASIRKPSKNALQPPVSPRPLAYALRDVLSARSSMPSATESFQDEAQTDTAPGNVKDTEFRSPAVLRPKEEARRKREDGTNVTVSGKESDSPQNPPKGERNHPSWMCGNENIAFRKFVSPRKLNNMSPTMLVMEQGPTTGKSRPGTESELRQYSTTQFNITIATGAHTPPRLASQSLSSSDDEGFHDCRSTRSKRSVSNTWAMNPVNPLNEESWPCGSTSSTKPEPRIERRMRALEIKNTLLEAALMAVLNASARKDATAQTSMHGPSGASGFRAASAPPSLAAVMENFRPK
ncbi:MAG: hypothetical protein M1830_000645 [Pleopsidium flavum]|nr:MAG: hypothetical protein M1830_000645 [Pleopsidium flavum]